MSAELDSGTWTIRRPGTRPPSPRRAWASFSDLYRGHYEFVWRCALRMGVPQGDIEDVVQETFVIALRRLDEFDTSLEGRASSWLFAILRNVIRNQARGERRRQARIAGYGEQPIDLEQRARADQVERTLGRRLLSEFLDGLDDKRRAVFVLAELEGLTGREIAAALDINVNTAHARLRAARQAFLDHFGSVEAPALARDEAIDVPEAARRRTWGVLVGLAPAQVGLASGLLGSLGLGKLALVLVLGGVAVAASVGVDRSAAGRASDAAPVEPVEPALVASAPSRVRVPAFDVLEPAVPIEVLAPKQASVPPRTRARSRERSDETAAYDELAAARAALLADDAERALALVRARRWPAALSDSARALEIGALCRLGRVDEARARHAGWDAAANVAICW